MQNLMTFPSKLINIFTLNHRNTIDEKITSVTKNVEGWTSSKDFSRILQMEIRRSYRTGSPLSYVLIDLLAGSNGKYTISSRLFTDFLQRLIQLISINSREFDIRSMTSPKEIGILLIDTSLDGAKIFTKKLTEEFLGHFEKLANNDFKYLLSLINISTYPLNRISGTSSVMAKPIINNGNEVKEIEIKRESERKNEQSMKVEINWDTKNIAEKTNGIPEQVSEINKDDFAIRLRYKLIKRMMDIIGSIIGLLLFFPLMIFIGISVKLSSSGPMLFKQKRIGYKGKSFTFLKFRSMRIDGNEKIHKEYVQKLIEGKNDEINMGSSDKPTYKITNDPRITAIGHILRRTSLDELPQLFNVLIGQMSLVGPRPPIPYEVEMYKSWHLQRILEVKPGVTGLWQVEGRSTTTFDEMVRMDLQYVRRKSIRTDIKIIFKTFAVVFKTEGAM